MNYEEKKFDGQYLNYYNIILSNGDATITDIYDYIPIASEIKALNWEGSSKDTICDTIEALDNLCNKSFYTYINCMIKKTKIVYKVLLKELELLKKTIDLYNQSVAEYKKIYSQLEYAKSIESKGDKS